MTGFGEFNLVHSCKDKSSRNKKRPTSCLPGTSGLWVGENPSQGGYAVEENQEEGRYPTYRRKEYYGDRKDEIKPPKVQGNSHYDSYCDYEDARPRFGVFKHLKAAQFVTEVLKVDSKAFVVVHLSKPHIESCVRLNGSLEALARQITHVKFCVIASQDLMEKLGDLDLPALVICRGGDIVEFIRVTDQLGTKFSDKDVAIFLNRFLFEDENRLREFGDYRRYEEEREEERYNVESEVWCGCGCEEYSGDPEVYYLSDVSTVVRLQKHRDCVAHAVASAIRSTECQILDRRPVKHKSLAAAIISEFGENATSLSEVLAWICSLRGLQFNLLTLNSARRAVKNGRTVVASIKLTEQEWHNFDVFFNRNPQGVLSPRSVGPPGGPKDGHSVVVVGYNATDSYWILKNSWGTNFADKGYFRLSDEFGYFYFARLYYCEERMDYHQPQRSPETSEQRYPVDDW